NESNYDLIVNRIDTTTNRVGKITLIDTARIVDGPANDEAKREYTIDAGGITERVYDADLVEVVDGEDGNFSRILYSLDHTNVHAADATVEYQTRAGLHYLWTEGQEKVTTTTYKYEKNSFNLFGGDTGFEDFL